jgi:hypothetical protein
MDDFQYPSTAARREAAEERFRLGRIAVKEGRLAEARAYLLKAVEIDQHHSDAWLWLSATTRDAQEQKKYLEWAVAANPANPEARRGLAILQGRLNANAVKPIGAEVEPRQPTEPEAAVVEQTFNCPQCGGVMRYDPQTTDLKCERCGHIQVVEEIPAKEVEQVLDLTLATEQGHRWAEAQRRMICQQCNATTIFPAGQTSVECPFCGSTVLLAAHDESDLLTPQAIIPMTFESEEARKYLRKWLGNGFFIPDDLAKVARTSQPRPAYIPFWVFEATVNGRWQAYVAEGYGRSRQWVWQTGEHIFFFANELVVGTKQLPPSLLVKTQPYNWEALVEYKPEYLAGWPAATYDIPLSKASLDAREHMVAKAQKELLYKAAPGKSVKDLAVSGADFGGVTYKQVLLPIWITSYTYRGKKYPILINGQTGAVAGHKPTDTVKVAIIALAAVIILLVLSFLVVILFGPMLGLTR